jgi:hypothetical protein
MEAIRSSETSAHTRYTHRHIPEDDIVQSHHHENPKSYIIYRSFVKISVFKMRIDIAVGIATGYWLDGKGSIPSMGRLFLFLTASRPALRPT